MAMADPGKGRGGGGGDEEPHKSRPSWLQLEQDARQSPVSDSNKSCLQVGFSRGFPLGFVFWGGVALVRRQSWFVAFPDVFIRAMIVGSGAAILTGAECKMESVRGVRDAWNKTAAGALSFGALKVLSDCHLETRTKEWILRRLGRGYPTGAAAGKGRSLFTNISPRGVLISTAVGAMLGGLDYYRTL